MPLARAVRSKPPAGAARRWAAWIWLSLVPGLHGCVPADRVARQDVESLQTNVQQMESNLQARQAGVYEQIRELREEQSRLDRLIEENGRQAKTVGQQVERLRERTQEELDRRDKLQKDSAQTLAEQAARLDGLQKDLQKGFETLNDNLVAMSAFEKKQEERIARSQEQLQNQLKVVVEEVGQENQVLNRSIAAVRTDLDETRQGLADLQGAVRQIAERLASAQNQLQDLGKRRETARKAGPARGGQHIVRAGETLTTIAARYGISLQTLMEANRITDANSIREGQKLSVPEP
jgi:chromosome segregation ATPase